MTFMCMRSQVVRGTTVLTSHEGCKDAAAALYSYSSLEHLQGLISDAPCMLAAYPNTRAPREFCGIKHTCDRLHVAAHTCFEVHSPDEYPKFDHMNTPLIEQFHAVMNTLGHVVRGSTLEHDMFLLQMLEDDHYIKRCDMLGVPEHRRHWPASL